MKSLSSPVGIIAPMNEDSRHNLCMGVDIGCTDIILRQKRDNITFFLFLELKTKKGRLSQSQKDWNKNFDEYYASDNCKRAVAYGYDEAVAIVNNWLNS